ncbi:BA14K family protein [Aureimonas psammosilenae]|uniref:BA14K family protein n=1 Tax=Aureimonas psammosilenae TaxID=2495496 RepID=UPI001260FA5E|nr:BA14K family protein [Aureimonas psammosilenae]
MRKFLLSLGAAATLAAGMVGLSAPSASADPYWGRGYGHGGYYRGGGGWGGDDRWRYRRGWRNHGGDALAAGAIGLGVGALLGTALTSRPYDDGRYYGRGYYGNGYDGGGYYGRPGVVLEGPAYIERPAYVERRVYYRPAPVYREVRPVRHYSRADRCAARYRTYDYRTNTYFARPGVLRECRL